MRFDLLLAMLANYLITGQLRSLFKCLNVQIHKLLYLVAAITKAP